MNAPQPIFAGFLATLALLTPLLAQGEGDAVPPNSSTEDMPSLRLLSYNIKHGEGMDGSVDQDRLAAAISAAEPDFVALQEVDRNTDRVDGLDQPAWLAQQIRFAHHDFARAIDLGVGEYGNAVLSRYPLVETEHNGLPSEVEPRVIELIRLEEPFPLSIANFHLAHENEATRLEQLELALPALAEVEGPLILLGDFNTTPGTKPLLLLAEHGFQRMAKEGKPDTFPADEPDREIDHLFIREGSQLSATDYQVIDEPMASDHRPIQAVIRPTATE